ncbi:MAG: Co/Zn/Cd cation transporter-like protein [Chthonomonadaceae bacterium]|nr:Co/Zn/Cd cation transporter-like protein [Chthonomonadaceae bacterium]
MISTPGAATRADQMRTALRLERLTLAWMVVEASASIGAGVMAHSVLLLAFGVDSIIELASAGLLYFRLSKEARAAPGDMAGIEALEQRASRISGWLLYLLALYVVLQSGYGLLHRHTAETSLMGLAVAVVAAFGMPVLAKAKLRIAEHIGSKALRADAMETFTCGFLSWVLLAGLGANALLHWWWLDSVTALMLVPFLIKEGREAISGECRCRDSCL